MKACYVIPEGIYAAAIADIVKMPIDSSKREYWVITRINVMEQFRGQGYGTRILEDILRDADAENVTLFLEPAASGGLSQEELIEWYKRHGFDYGTWHMKRKPKGSDGTESLGIENNISGIESGNSGNDDSVSG